VGFGAGRQGHGETGHILHFLEEHDDEELESEEEQLDEWEEEEHQSLTESATDSSFVTGTMLDAFGPPRILSPGTDSLSQSKLGASEVLSMTYNLPVAKVVVVAVVYLRHRHPS
jgi:hypothetical protein